MKLVNVLKTFYYLRMVLMIFVERALLPEVVKFVAKKSMTMQNLTTFNKKILFMLMALITFTTEDSTNFSECCNSEILIPGF